MTRSAREDAHISTANSTTAASAVRGDLENVKHFDVRMFNSGNLVIAAIPIDAPWNASEEIYALAD
ncbi:hypothetical protein [Acidicapsa acidisoli]|uniref:hypothetical protein n=1 Tax=Acidicapsa acidisoli TaxID=1615681 RepID=UPI0021E08032|nr:hypothetical protein [Acidicapsa acidisoli]